ncbi:MAG: hypothetical protein ACRBBK_08485 [Paracoccaceae bacterium]
MRVLRFIGPVLGLAALAACDPAVPDSGAGVGFDTYSNYEVERAKREAALNGRAQTGAGSATQTAAIVPPAAGSDDAIGAEALAALGSGAAAAESETARTPIVIDANNPGISDENDFDAVTGRESIEDNAQKIAAQREAYKVIEPTAVPTSSGGAATLVQYALSTSNLVGQGIYSRSIIAAQSRYQRNCAKFSSPAAAQEEFLKRGGPKRDPQGIDPDGDGFACTWDPAPFRLAAQR